MSFLLEETKGNLPVWLAPHQVKILPISEKHIEYANEVKNTLNNAGVPRVEVDERNEKIGYKIREAQLLKVPYMLVVGDKEVESKKVSVRSRKDGDIGQMSIEEFTNKVLDDINNKK